jgi:hypothetical protein
VEAFIERPGEVVTSGCLLSHARVTPARLKALRPDQRTTKVLSTVVATVPVYPPGDERRAAMKGLGIRSPGGRKREGHSERPGGGSPATAGPRRAQGLWQDAGRSAAGPVHWPLWPAPLPPLVGGRGLAHAAEAVPSTAAVAMAPATRRFFMFPPFPGSRPGRRLRPNRLLRGASLPDRSLWAQWVVPVDRRGSSAEVGLAPDPKRRIGCIRDGSLNPLRRFPTRYEMMKTLMGWPPARRGWSPLGRRPPSGEGR